MLFENNSIFVACHISFLCIYFMKPVCLHELKTRIQFNPHQINKNLNIVSLFAPELNKINH